MVAKQDTREVSALRVGDVVEVISGVHTGKSGLVTSLHSDGKVEVELADGGGVLKGFRYWFLVEDVLAGGSRSRVKRAKASRKTERETRVEVRAVCKHLNLADLCPDCARSRGVK